jgi:very-short-patch-repair endonuclease
MRPQSATDLELGRLATAQHGVVARQQLLALGFSDGSVKRRVRGGRLHLLHRGVYAVGHRSLTVDGRRMAAVMAAGRDAVLSHATAAAAWELRRNAGAIHVTIPGDPGRRRRTGLRVHRSRTLTPSDTTTHRGIPITTPARTIIDLAHTLTGRPLEHALDLAEQRNLIDFGEFKRRPVPRSLQAVLSLYAAGATPTRSELEERFLKLCDDHGISRPNVNTRIEGREVDFAWPDRRLIVEVDGYAYHRSPTAFEDDRERDVNLVLAGWRVLRFTWAQITRRPAWVARSVTGADIREEEYNHRPGEPPIAGET